MSEEANGQPTVIRTGRGLTIAGTRITLYALLDYFHADWPPKLIQNWFDLSDKQMADVLSYLAAHGDEVESEYQKVLQQAEANRQYWENRLLERGTPVVQPASPEVEELRKKLQEWKAQLERI